MNDLTYLYKCDFFVYKKVGKQLLALLSYFLLLLYSASCKQSEKYYDDSDDEQYPNDGSKVEDEKAQKPQQDKNQGNREK